MPAPGPSGAQEKSAERACSNPVPRFCLVRCRTARTRSSALKTHRFRPTRNPVEYAFTATRGARGQVSPRAAFAASRRSACAISERSSKNASGSRCDRLSRSTRLASTSMRSQRLGVPAGSVLRSPIILVQVTRRPVRQAPVLDERVERGPQHLASRAPAALDLLRQFPERVSLPGHEARDAVVPLANSEVRAAQLEAGGHAPVVEGVRRATAVDPLLWSAP